MTANNIPHMETIKNTAKIFGLAEHFVRQLVIKGEIAAVKAGCKYLVNVDKFAEYLNSNTLTPTEQETPTKCGGIKPVPVKL
ncbi:MAG: helix-turn-helix domain-containing protein [Oscillospiraceae bacterium]|nr:helix-turn-helix domain-containing protein [Oscillospiraceae bacterium]